MFKDKLRKLREEKGLSQYELADKIFVSRSAIAKWENGFGMPSIESIEILCEFFGVTKEYLLQEDEPLQIIENVQKRSRKKLIFVSSLLVPLVLYFVVSIIFFTCDKINDRHTMQYDTFYKVRYLRKFNLETIKIIESDSYSTGGTASPYFYADIDSYEIFDDYVKYIYEKLFYSPEFSYLGFSVKILSHSENYLYNRNIFLMQSANLSDHIVKVNSSNGFPTEYEFYFMTKNNDGRFPKEAVEIKYLNLKCNKKSNTDKYNFTMRLDKCPMDDGFPKHYLVNEFYNIEKITLTKENIEQFINVKYNWLSISFSSKFDDLIYNDKLGDMPYEINVKLKYRLTPRLSYSELDLQNITKYYNLSNFEFYEISDYDVGGSYPYTKELEKYDIEIDYEILENSYFYRLTPKN